MASNKQQSAEDTRRMPTPRRRHAGLTEHVIARTRGRAPVDPDTVVTKTYRLHAGVVGNVQQAAEDHQVGVGELVEWLLAEGLADLAAGRKQLPVVTVPPVTPLGRRRRGGQPKERRIAGTVEAEPE